MPARNPRPRWQSGTLEEEETPVMVEVPHYPLAGEEGEISDAELMAETATSDVSLQMPTGPPEALGATPAQGGPGPARRASAGTSRGSTRAASSSARTAATGGGSGTSCGAECEDRDFATLAMTWSHDPAVNMMRALESRLLTYQWKKLVWSLRARRAFLQSGLTWRRPARWLGQLQAREAAWIWGHMGSAVRSLRGPLGAEVNRGPPGRGAGAGPSGPGRLAR